MLPGPLKALKSSPMFQLSLSSKELFHSNFIAWLCEEQPVLMARVFGKLDARIISVKREKKNIDLTLSFDDGSKIILENKVKSLPDRSQLKNYISVEERCEYFLLTMTAPAFNAEILNWGVLLYDDFADRLSDHLVGSELVSNQYHLDLISDYVDFIRSISDYSKIYDVGIDSSYFLGTSENENLNELRLNDLIQKRRMNQMENLLKARLGGRVYDEVKVHFLKSKSENIKKGAFSLSTGFTRGTGLLDLKYVAMMDPYVLLGVQLQGCQLRVVVETENQKLSDEWFGKLKDNWISRFVSEFSLKGKFEFSKQKTPYCSFSAFLYKYLKVSDEATVGDILDVFYRSIDLMDSLSESIDTVDE